MTGTVVVHVLVGGTTITATAAAVDARMERHHGQTVDELGYMAAMLGIAGPAPHLLNTRTALLALLASHDDATRRQKETTTP